ncbi:MAG: DUF5684 domain-containing protein [Chthoniobacterales bacterium]
MNTLILLAQNSGLAFSAPIFLAQDSTPYEAPSAAGGLMGGAFGIVWLILCLVVLIALWKVFTKAGQPGWAAIIPIFNLYIFCKIAGRPGWWLLLMLIPIVNFIIWIILSIDLAKNFGKGAGFGIGIALLSFIFLPVLGFGDAQYQGAAKPVTA